MTNQIARKVCGEFYVSGKSYHSPLPSKLQEWYAYCSDGGHCIVCCLKSDYKADGDLTNYLLPVPVKSVLRGYETLRGYVVVDLPYSIDYGLVVPKDDDEF